MQLLHGAIRTYAWGSRTAIAEFTGRPAPTAHPEAELWLGAHPGDSAMLVDSAGQTSLLDVIAADPDGELGPAVRDRFGDALPFLVKVLAADEPLSLQAHPSAQQAVEGNIAGVTRSLGVAFNSTFIALLISIVLMFLVHQLQAAQERLVRDTETHVDRCLIRHLRGSRGGAAGP